MMQPTSGDLTIAVAEDGLNSDRLDELTHDLIEQLRSEARVEARRAEAAEVPKNSRSAEAVTIGAIVLALIPAAIPAVVETLKIWLETSKKRRIVVRMGGNSFEFDPKTTSPEMIEVLKKQLGDDAKN